MDELIAADQLLALSLQQEDLAVGNIGLQCVNYTNFALK